MKLSTHIRRACIAAAVCCAMRPSALSAAPFLEFVDPHPGPGNQFGVTTVVLSTGNVVITAPGDDFAAHDAGAVYLFNGATGALISVLRGSTASDRIGGSGVTVLANGNYVINSSDWNNGAIADAGASTWGSGTTGVSGTISAANSLVGSTASDRIGFYGARALTNGNYVVQSPDWHNGAATFAGAVTWGNGTTGVTGVISAANSLVGSHTGDHIGYVQALANGNYVVMSNTWTNGANSYAGAVSWGNGTTGTTGVVSAANSLVGTKTGDQVGNGLVTELTNGNYIVSSYYCDNGAIDAAGAVTWGSGTTGVSGVVSAANSLVGSKASDYVGFNGVTALSNGNYVVVSYYWDNGAVADVGAATWADGTTGITGPVSAANSLIGSMAGDQVGSAGVKGLTNGNYVVSSTLWDNGAIADVGAATWGNGTTGVTGPVSAANSLVGATAADSVGRAGVTPLANGNYVVGSSRWDYGVYFDAGAATWGNGTTGISGTVSAANSLIGASTGDQVSSTGVTALTNGNYVVRSAFWNDGSTVDVGAASWGDGATGISGTVSDANSLIGSTAGDNVGSVGVTPLANGNYVVASSKWDDGAAVDAGAATWGSGTGGVSGAVSATNSLVGSASDDQVGSGGATGLVNGNYVVVSPRWDDGSISNAGAATWGSGSGGVSGPVSAANSAVGSINFDNVGSHGVTPLSDGNYVVNSSFWHTSTSAATWGDGSTGVSGAVGIDNSLVGGQTVSNLQRIVEDTVNHTFLAWFLQEAGGRVRVGPPKRPPVILTVVDVANDQGGSVQVTFTRSDLDDAIASPPVTTYGIWRHVPGTQPAGAARANPSAGPDAATTKRLLAVLAAQRGVRASDGHLSLTGRGPGETGIASEFPPGTWDLVASIPAAQQGQYVMAAPTLSNAAANDFVVTAHTAMPAVYFVSSPASGQSVDNLAPAQPTPFTASYSDGATHLQWGANAEADFDAYHLHRGVSADFIPGPGNLIATQGTTGYDDVGPPGSSYKLSAVDVNGNESPFALVLGTTAVGETPVVFALNGVRTNPTTGRDLRVAFALPTAAAARLELLDVSGRRMLAREVGSLGVGRHTVQMAEQRGVPSGIYWLRLTQGDSRQTLRVAVVD